jgi:hypothetical protein
MVNSSQDFRQKKKKTNVLKELMLCSNLDMNLISKTCSLKPDSAIDFICNYEKCKSGKGKRIKVKRIMRNSNST